jgi:hypothetical protein
MSVAALRKYCLALAMVAIASFAYPALAEDARAYTNGNVVQVTSVLTKPGKFDEYMSWLAGPFRQEQEELKKAGLIISYGIYSAAPRRPEDPDLYLVVTYKDMATLDTIDEKSEAIDRKIFGSLKQANEGAASRESMRTILGTELLRELKLK